MMKPFILICLMLAGCSDFDARLHLSCSNSERTSMQADFNFCQVRGGTRCDLEAISRNCSHLSTAGKIWSLGQTEAIQKQFLTQPETDLPVEAIPTQEN